MSQVHLESTSRHVGPFLPTQPFNGLRVRMSHPDSRSDSIGRSEPSSGRETIYWDSLPVFFFFESKYHIQKYRIKLPLEWCPSKSIHIYGVPFTYTKTLLSITYSESRTYCDEPLLVCWPSCMRMFSDVFSCTYTD